LELSGGKSSAILAQPRNSFRHFAVAILPSGSGTNSRVVIACLCMIKSVYA
jgi:hypothetical protein